MRGTTLDVYRRQIQCHCIWSVSDVYGCQNMTSMDAPGTERAILPMHYMMAEVYVPPNPFSAGTEFRRQYMRLLTSDCDVYRRLPH